MTIKLVASDLDGTLLTPEHVLSDRTIEVVREVRASGVRIVAATGRGPLSTWPVLQGGHDVIDAALASNGAVVLDLPSNRVSHRFPLDPTAAGALVRQVRRDWPEAVVAWETASGFGADRDFATQVPFLDELELLSVHGLAMVELDVEDELTKLLIAHPTLVKKDLMDAVAAIAPNLVATSSGVDFVEVSGAGIDKSAGLRHLCADWGIAADEVMAFGDNWNDMAMLEWAGVGVAMGHASAEVAACADLVIGSNADNAVAEHLAATLLKFGG